jgi:hypothetical protein
MTEEKIIRKIRKLLALSESPNEHEAHTAAMKAQELLARHHLSIADVSEDSETEVKEGDSAAANDPGDRTLAKVIGDNYRCGTLIRGWRSAPGKKHILFVGIGEDPEVAMVMYKYAKKIMHKCCRDYIADLERQLLGSFSTREKKRINYYYYRGFCKRLNQILIDSRTKHQEEWGLILVTPAAVTAYMDNIPPEKDPKKNNYDDADPFDAMAYARGYKDGNIPSNTTLPDGGEVTK